MSVTVYCRGHYITSFGLEDSFPEYTPTEQEFDAYEKLFELYLEKWLEKNTLTEEEWAKSLDREGGDYVEYIRREWDSWKNDVWEEFWNVFDNKKELLAYVGRNNAAAVRRLMATIERETKRREQGETDDAL